MKIESTIQEDHQAKLVVEIETEVFEGSKRKAAKQLAKRIKISGFRPGKAPYNMVLRQVGDAAIVEEAIDIILKDEYPKIIEEAGIEPYAPGSLTDIPELDPPTFEFLVPLAPEVTLGEYQELRLDFEEPEVTDNDIQAAIDNMRDQQAVIEPVERASEEGDMVYALVSGERKKAKEDEEKVLFEERRYPVVIEKEDKESDDEWPFPGFSRNLIGLSAGDESSVTHKFPKDYQYEELQGVNAVFAIKIEEIKARNLPEVDDEFAKSAGEYETVDEMLADIRKSLEENHQSTAKSEYESKIMDLVVEESTIKYPPQMMEHEIEHLLEDLTREVSYQGMDIDMYLKTRDIDMDALNEEMTPTAEARIKRGLALMEIGKAEEITVSFDKVQEQAQQTISFIQQMYPPEQARKLTSKEAYADLVNRIMSDQITQDTLERLRKIAMGIDWKAEEEEKKKEEETEEAAESAEIEEAVEEVEASMESTDESVEEELSTKKPAEDIEESVEETDSTEEA